MMNITPEFDYRAPWKLEFMEEKILHKTAVHRTLNGVFPSTTKTKFYQIRTHVNRPTFFTSRFDLIVNNYFKMLFEEIQLEKLGEVAVDYEVFIKDDLSAFVDRQVLTFILSDDRSLIMKKFI